MKIDFLARRFYYLRHLKPIWNALSASQRGQFYMNADTYSAAGEIMEIEKHYVPYIENEYCGNGPIVTAAYGDAVRAADANPSRPVTLLEHGVGLSFGKAEYSSGFGQREKLALIPVQSQYILDRIHPDIKNKPHPIIGVPVLDPWAGEFRKPHSMPKKPTIAIAFHHGSKVSRPAEIGSAWKHYADILPELVKHYKVLFHVHPLSGDAVREASAMLTLPPFDAGLNKLAYNQWESNPSRPEYVETFEEIMHRADIFINDCSSTLYQFCVTGKPVIILNAPWFNRDSKWGIRFWDYTDIGPQVEDPAGLIPAIDRMIAAPEDFKPYRSKMVSDLFPYLGTASERAVDTITEFLSKQKPAARRTVDKIVTDPAWSDGPVFLPTERPQGAPRTGRFFIARNTDSDDMFHQALLSAGYVEVDHPSVAEFIVHDAVHPGLDRFLDSHPVFVTPHTPQSSFLWDGILEQAPVCCNFVYGEAGRMCMKSYGYPYRVEPVGFARCEVLPFKPTKGRDLLIVPAHPSRRGQYTNSEYLTWGFTTLKWILSKRGSFGKVTLCWSETRIDPDLAQEMRKKDIDHVVANPWTDPEPLKHMIERVEAADLVVSCNTTGCVSVARGKPTVFFPESREPPASGTKKAINPDLYLGVLRFPLAIESMSIDDLLSVREAPNDEVEKWKRNNIGGNFNASKFIEVVKEYIK